VSSKWFGGELSDGRLPLPVHRPAALARPLIVRQRNSTLYCLDTGAVIAALVVLLVTTAATQLSRDGPRPSGRPRSNGSHVWLDNWSPIVSAEPSKQYVFAADVAPALKAVGGCYGGLPCGGQDKYSVRRGADGPESTLVSDCTCFHH
jgi:hypothetical protein